MTLMPGTRLGSYEVTNRLGSGGMGDVYRAKDLKLGRAVAVKVLRADLASDPERLRRFEQEARAASALNHPNIITIHDIGKHGTTPYIAMEFVDGKTLRELVSEGPMPTEKLLRYATQIAEGLAKAHGAGIIHRDLKPENLMVTNDGYVKILDFGLAKLLPQPGADSEAATINKEGTVAGAVMGTASYMSPEQALGNPLDARTDVFSFGAVLYEMATGGKPFQGDTPARLFDQILHKEVASPSSLNPELTRDFDKIIGKALEKDSANRYPSARELLVVLNNARLDSTLPQVEEQKSIVILPFENMSPDPDQEYFCDGMTEEIIADLSKIQSLRVISRTSSMRLKGTDKDIGTIGKELKVQFVLEGSVRRAGNDLRITAQLIDASNDAHLWTEKYGGTLEDVFDIQERVSRSIVDGLKLKLDQEANGRISARPITDVRAYECYLQARYHVWLLSEESLHRALELVERGLEIVGGNDLLYALKGMIYIHYVSNLMRPPDTFENLLHRARECAAKALELNPSSAPALFTQGLACFKSGNPIEAKRYWTLAVDIDSNHVEANLMLGYLLAIGGRNLDGSRRQLEKAARLDPLSTMGSTAAGWLHVFKGEFGCATQIFLPLQQQLEQAQSPFSINLAWMHALQQNTEEAIRIIDLILKNLPGHVMAELGSFLKSAWLGERQRALESVTERLERAAWWDELFPLMMAEGCSVIGEPNGAFRWLEHSIDYGLANVRFFEEHDPFLENLRARAEFKHLMEKARRVSELVGI